MSLEASDEPAVLPAASTPAEFSPHPHFEHGLEITRNRASHHAATSAAATTGEFCPHPHLPQAPIEWASPALPSSATATIVLIIVRIAISRDRPRDGAFLR